MEIVSLSWFTAVAVEINLLLQVKYVAVVVIKAEEEIHSSSSTQVFEKSMKKYILWHTRSQDKPLIAKCALYENHYCEYW